MAERWDGPRHRRDGDERPVRGDRAGRDPFDSTVLELDAIRAELEVTAAMIRAAIDRERRAGGDR